MGLSSYQAKSSIWCAVGSVPSSATAGLASAAGRRRRGGGSYSPPCFSITRMAGSSRVVTIGSTDYPASCSPLPLVKSASIASATWPSLTRYSPLPRDCRSNSTRCCRTSGCAITWLSSARTRVWSNEKCVWSSADVSFPRPPVAGVGRARSVLPLSAASVPEVFGSILMLFTKSLPACFIGRFSADLNAAAVCNMAAVCANCRSEGRKSASIRRTLDCGD